MIEKVGQAVKIVKTVIPYVKTGIRGFHILHNGRAFLEGHSSKYRLKLYLKRLGKQQKKKQKHYNCRVRKERLSLFFNKECLLWKTALILHKRYF